MAETPTPNPNTELQAKITAAMAKAGASGKSPMDLIGGMLNDEIAEGLQRADRFEAFCKTALADIMKRLIAVDNNQKALFALLSSKANGA